MPAPHIRPIFLEYYGDPYRGALLQFDTGDGRGNELVTFLPRPQMDAAEVILLHDCRPGVAGLPPPVTVSVGPLGGGPAVGPRPPPGTGSDNAGSAPAARSARLTAELLEGGPPRQVIHR